MNDAAALLDAPNKREISTSSSTDMFKPHEEYHKHTTVRACVCETVQLLRRDLVDLLRPIKSPSD